MPNRILRDWTDSDKIEKLDVHTERFFTRLIMKVDDFGRYSSNVKLLKSTLYPLKSDIRETDITRWLTECEKAGLIALYDVAEKGYLQINDFRQVLRQKKEKYPPPITCLADYKQTTSRRMVETKRNESEEEEEPPPPKINNTIELELLQMFKRSTMGMGYEDQFLEIEVNKFLNKYPNTIAKQSGGLVNSWTARLNKKEQDLWKENSKKNTGLSGQTVREQKDAAFLKSILV